VWQQFLEVCDRPPVAEFLKQVGEVRERWHAVLRAGPHQTIKVGGAARGGMGPGKQIVFASDRDVA
jgi:hypothetical protein